MVTVRTKEELKKTIQSKEQRIEIVGPLASEIIKKQKIKKSAKIGAAVAILGGLVSAPFTGGASLVATGAGVSAASGGTVVILVAIAAITGLSRYAIKKNYNVKIGCGNNKLELISCIAGYYCCPNCDTTIDKISLL